MHDRKFEKIIRDNEKDLQRIRCKYFPLIRNSAITGYNLYPASFDYSRGRLFLNYLHSDLKKGDVHFESLFEKLKSAALLEEMIIFDTEVVDKEAMMAREADYITKANWKDSPKMRYFDFLGNEIDKEEAKHSGEDMIGEALQYDWLIRISNETKLRHVADIFKTYASKFKIDQQGRKIIKSGMPAYNSIAVPEAWDIPLLIVTSKDNKKPKNLDDFLKVTQVNIEERLSDTPVILSTLVRSKTKQLQIFLDESSCKARYAKKYALRVFVEDYLT